MDNDGKSTICGYDYMNLIVVGEQIIKLQPAKKMNLTMMIMMMMNELVDVVLEKFELTYHLLHCFPDVKAVVARIDREPLFNERSLTYAFFFFSSYCHENCRICFCFPTCTTSL